MIERFWPEKTWFERSQTYRQRDSAWCEAVVLCEKAVETMVASLLPVQGWRQAGRDLGNLSAVACGCAVMEMAVGDDVIRLWQLCGCGCPSLQYIQEQVLMITCQVGFAVAAEARPHGVSDDVSEEESLEFFQKCGDVTRGSSSRAVMAHTGSAGDTYGDRFGQWAWEVLFGAPPHRQRWGISGGPERFQAGRAGSGFEQAEIRGVLFFVGVGSNGLAAGQL
ncbi:hypothetical protein JZ751_026858 [Albula glossodonta]|uniref:Uncharacterized protein n=1 Tax=Albula glossodonta TaxID=121402 RepID=A0A8T2PL47_9TELE|nr:hypothetical protein JZ751_026858 [Albula glossodonta]